MAKVFLGSLFGSGLLVSVEGQAAMVDSGGVVEAPASVDPPTTADGPEPSVEAPEPADPSEPVADPSEPVADPSGPAAEVSGPAADPAPSAWPQPLTVQTCPFAAPAIPQQTETALDATLLVKTAEGFGSAVLISPDGFALTAAHVVGTSDTVQLVNHHGAGLQATVVRVDEPQDVALLKVGVTGPSPCLRPLDGRAPLGSDVFILGSPAGEELSFSVAKGIVSGYRELDGSRFVQLDAAVNPGNSGGPAMSPEGSIVGIASWKVSHVSMEGLAFAVPTDVALQALGVELGAASSADWASLTGRHASSSSSSAAAPRPHVDPAAAIDPSLLRRRRIRRGLIVWGITSASVGAAAITTTAAIYYSLDRMTAAGWSALRVTNAIGWGLAGTGSAMLVAGLIIRKNPKRSSPHASLLPTGRGLVLQGRF